MKRGGKRRRGGRKGRREEGEEREEWREKEEGRKGGKYLDSLKKQCYYSYSFGKKEVLQSCLSLLSVASGG